MLLRGLAVASVIVALLTSCNRKADEQLTSVAGEGSATGKGRATASASSAPEDGPQPIVELPGVDTSRLVPTEQRLFSKIVQSKLSPCGEPISLERCVREKRACRACLPAAKYVAKMVTLGVDAVAIGAWLDGRFTTTPALVPGAGSPAIGAAKPAVTIVEFMDFECPHCGVMAPILRAVVAEPEFAATTSLVVKHFPLKSHPHARDAAIAAIAADAQGKFFPMYDAIFAHQTALEARDLEGYARTVGCDVAIWKRALVAPATIDRLDRDQTLGASLGFVGVPTVYVDGRELRPLGDVDPMDEQLRAWIRLDLDLMKK